MNKLTSILLGSEVPILKSTDPIIDIDIGATVEFI